MSDIADLMASNDPMATPVMSIGPAPPVNTTPPQVMDTMHEKQVEQMSPLSAMLPDKNATKNRSKLTPDQKIAIITGICTFIVFLPNMQQLLTQHLPILTTNTTLHLLVNSVLVAILFCYMKDHMIEVL